MKRFIATLLLSITLFLSVFNSYRNTITAQATEVAAASIMQSIMALFGVSSGLGNQSDFWERAGYFERVVDAAKNGSTYSFSDYGDVDFSDSDSVSNWLTWSRGFDSYLKNSATTGTTYTSTMVTMAKALDAASYASSGVSATTSISNHIQDAIDSAKDGTLVDDIKSVFTNIADNVTDADFDWNKYLLVAGVIGSSLVSDASACGQYLDALLSPEETAYTEYANSFADVIDGYSGSYPLFVNEYYNYSGKYYIAAIEYQNSENVSDLYYLFSPGYKIFGVPDSLYDGRFDFFYIDEYGSAYSYTMMRESWNLDSHSFYRNSGSRFIEGGAYGISCYFPIFSSVDAAKAAFAAGDLTTADNYTGTSSYSSFKSNTGSITDSLDDALDEALARYLARHPALAATKALADRLYADLPSVVGTADYADTAVKVASESATDTDTGDDSASGTGTYSGILGKILAAILALTTGIWELFCSPITTMVSGVNALVGYAKTLIKELVEYLQAILDGILALDMTVQFPDISDDESGDVSSPSGGTVNFLNGLLVLISILFMLLKIFLHLLEFIVNIFKIESAPGFITGDFATGFDYIKSVQLSPLSISVYDFLMGLIHILLIFSVVKNLKHHIDKIHI